MKYSLIFLIILSNIIFNNAEASKSNNKGFFEETQKILDEISNTADLGLRCVKFVNIMKNDSLSKNEKDKEIRKIVVGAVTSRQGGAFGAGIGKAIGAVGGPIGSFLGGVIGSFLGSHLGEKVSDSILDKTLKDL